MSLRTHETIESMRAALMPARAAGRSIGLVPTMGALHEGHASLVREARRRCDVVCVSVFVNPTQFAPGEDLERYPRTLEADRALLEETGADELFLPAPAEVYPAGFATRVEMAGLTEVLCGRSRPQHFSGVLTVCLKLFAIHRPDLAFFGRKDYQQVQVIRRMVKDLDLGLEIVPCPIVREEDGLALSSRNRYLQPEEREQGLALRAAALAAERAFAAGERGTERLLEAARAELSARPLVRIDYCELRDPEDLSEREGVARDGDLLALAAWLGETRLIDNHLLGEGG